MRYVTHEEITLALEERGAGETTLLFAHGWISSRRMWYDVVDRLDPRRFRSLLLDFRGAGLSDRPADGHDFLGYLSDLEAALAACGDAVLVAHSMGGKLAQYLAAARPPALRKLILVAPGTADAYAINPQHRALAEEAFGSRTRIEAFQRAAMRRAVEPAVMERIVDDALIAQREAWFGWYDRGRNVAFADRLARIAVPTLVVAGEHDPLAPPARLKRNVAERIGGALFVSLRNAGHNLPVETPGEIAGAIERFA